MGKKNKQKYRAEFRKRHDGRTRRRDFTRDYREHGGEETNTASSERISGKGELTRKRTIIGGEAPDAESGLGVELEIDPSQGFQGRVLSVHGLNSKVQRDDGRVYSCATRGLLKNLHTDQRHVVAAGDNVFVRPTSDNSGVIERIEPRRGTLDRTSRGRRHVMVANIDQLLIVASAAEPDLKPNLIDRFLVAAEQMQAAPLICINKIDLVDPADLQPLAGVYGRMGYETLFLSAQTGFGVDRLTNRVAGRQSVVAGQSGVGKSSLLNAIEPGLNLHVAEISEDTNKGRHTTTTARLIPLSIGGYIVDTPGIRQFQLWDVVPEEVAGCYRDIRPFVSQCKFPDCTHTHEDDCAVKGAVADGRIDVRRYESYCRLFSGDEV